MPDLRECAEEIITDTDRLARFTPDGASAFRLLVSSIEERGPTSPVSKAVMAAALAVASRCEACAGRHARNAAHAGAERGEFKLALERGVLMADAPAAIVAAQALRDFDAAATATQGRKSRVSRFLRAPQRKRSRRKCVDGAMEAAEPRPPYAFLLQ